MTTLHTEELAESTAARGFWTRSRKAGAIFVGLGLFAIGVFGSFAPADEVARFTFSDDKVNLSIPVPAQLGAMGFGALCVLAGIGLLTRVASRHLAWATVLGLFGFLMSFLSWQVAGGFLPMVAFIKGGVFLALPLVFGSLSGVLCERAGVINIGIEAQFLMGAFAGALIGTATGSLWLGLFGALVAGLAIASLLAVFAIRYLVDQIVLGVILVVLATGLTSFLYERLMQPHADTLNKPERFQNIPIPVLSEIPLIGPALFNSNMFLYLAVILVAVVHLILFYTRWGLRVRAVGEHPTAADTVGVKVQRVRYLSVLAGGVVSGIGGAYFTLGQGHQFNKEMTDGAGYIALAAMIFGRYSPVGALGAAMLFGFASQLNVFLAGIDSEIPSEFLGMTPYIATIFAVAGLVGKVRPPAADGKPYVKG